MPDIGVLRVLTSQQRATGWRRQVEVEKSLGLEKGAISRFFRMLGRAHKSKSTFPARRQLRVAGVYRVQDPHHVRPRIAGSRLLVRVTRAQPSTFRERSIPLHGTWPPENKEAP